VKIWIILAIKNIFLGSVKLNIYPKVGQKVYFNGGGGEGAINHNSKYGVGGLNIGVSRKGRKISFLKEGWGNMLFEII
jgi:hypothetical protein